MEQGRRVLLLADTSGLPATLDIVLPMVAAAWGDPSPAESVVVRKARWNFAELDDWGRYLGQYVLPLGGVTSWYLDARANRITYDVADADALRRIEARLLRLGVPCGLVVVQIRPGIDIR